MTRELVHYCVEDHIATITLDRPEKLNAVNPPMEEQLHEAFDRFDLDDSAWVAVVCGEGRAFCAGIDVKERLHDGDPAVRDRRMSVGPPPEGWFGRVVNWKPIITAVQGYCVGLGMVLALEGELVVAADDAQFGITETIRGVAAGPLWARLQTFMPSKVATEMLLTGKPIPAARLYELGLLNRLVPRDEMLSAAMELAKDIAAAAPLAVRGNTRLTRWPSVQLAAQAGQYTSALHLHRSEDFSEASRAFVEKRPPVFRAR